MRRTSRPPIKRLLCLILPRPGAAAPGEGDASGAKGTAGDFEGAELAAFFAGLIGGGGEVVGRFHLLALLCLRWGVEFKFIVVAGGLGTELEFHEGAQIEENLAMPP